MGRLVLLVAAYAPVGLIVGARVVPDYVGYVAIGVGLIGVAAWVGFLRWLPTRQPRTVRVTNLEPIDTEVTGYIVSILLPLVAAGHPSAGDLVAYGLCALLILFVAFMTDLAAVNPFIYAFGYRVVRADVEGRPAVLLVPDVGTASGCVTVVSAIGVMLVTDSGR